jgi:hypothetical protein
MCSISVDGRRVEGKILLDATEGWVLLGILTKDLLGRKARALQRKGALNFSSRVKEDLSS